MTTVPPPEPLAPELASTIPPPPIIKICPCCRKEYTLEEFRKLPGRWFMDLRADGDQRLEMRQCTCHSSIGIELTS